MPDTPATSYPEEWLTAIAAAIHDVDCPDAHCSGAALGHCYRLARAVLDRLAPLIDAEREDVHDLGYIQGVSEGTAAAAREQFEGAIAAAAAAAEDVTRARLAEIEAVVRASERERWASLAESVGATYPHYSEPGYITAHPPFAELIRKGRPNG